MRNYVFGLMMIAVLTIMLGACTANQQESTGSEEQQIKNVVRQETAGLQQIYEKHYVYKPQSGSLKIKFFITDSGKVQNAELTVDWGSFTPEFVAEIRSKILTWEFNIHNPHIYSFKITFEK